MKLLTIKNHKILEGVDYNNEWHFLKVTEILDQYIFVLESKHSGKTQEIIVRREQSDDGTWLARYNNEWFHLRKEDFKTPLNLINAFKKF